MASGGLNPKSTLFVLALCFMVMLLVFNAAPSSFHVGGGAPSPTSSPTTATVGSLEELPLPTRKLRDKPATGVVNLEEKHNAHQVAGGDYQKNTTTTTPGDLRIPRRSLAPLLVVPSDSWPICEIEKLGKWEYPPVSGGSKEKVAPVWTISSEIQRENQCRYDIFTQAQAVKCLEGQFLLFYGNSNTRTLFTALEALLRGQEQVSRVAAKQKCDNSKNNHSCATTVVFNESAACLQHNTSFSESRSTTRKQLLAEIEKKDATLRRLHHRYRVPLPNGGSEKNRDPPGGLSQHGWVVDHKPIRLFYWGFIKDIYDPSLQVKMGDGSPQQRMADMVVCNSQLNVIQANANLKSLLEGHRRNGPDFNKFAAGFVKTQKPPTSSSSSSGGGRSSASSFYWHSTTDVCPNQPHFKRYKYQKKFWSGRTPEQTNDVIAESNKAILAVLDPKVISVLDGAALSEDKHHSQSGGTDESPPPPPLCPHYDDPLHHRFLDKALIQVLLNNYCPNPRLWR